MTVTAHVTRYVRRTFARTFGVSHGPITRPDPNRPDPAHMQLHQWSPTHHGVRLGDGSAAVVAPSPVAPPDAMMSLRQIEHLDFEHSCDVPGCERPAGIVVEVLPHLAHVFKSARVLR